jgi:hypothetical protein
MNKEFSKQEITMVSPQFEYRFPRKLGPNPEKGDVIKHDNEISAWRKAYEKWWVNRFSGHIPQNWIDSSPRAIEVDFEKTQLEETRNRTEQILALVTESNYLYCLEVITNVKLSAYQFGTALAHPEFSRKEILDSLDGDLGKKPSLNSLIQRQKELGMTDEKVEEALRLASKIINERKSFSAASVSEITVKSRSKKNKDSGIKLYGVEKVVKYSKHDRQEGVRVPRKLDRYTAAALGIAYGCGYFNDPYFILSSPNINSDFFHNSVGQVFTKAFGLPLRNPKSYLTEKQFGDGTLVIQYGSQAITSFLLDYLGFPRNRKEKKGSDDKSGMSIPDCIKIADEKEQNEFLKYFLASTITSFTFRDGFIIHSVSKKLLQDIQELINARVSKKVGKSNPNNESKGNHKNTHRLIVGRTPAMELFVSGYLDVNPTVRNKAETCFRGNLGPQTRALLEENYPDQLKATQLRLSQPEVVIYSR